MPLYRVPEIRWDFAGQCDSCDAEFRFWDDYGSHTDSPSVHDFSNFGEVSIGGETVTSFYNQGSWAFKRELFRQMLPSFDLNPPFEDEEEIGYGVRATVFKGEVLCDTCLSERNHREKYNQEPKLVHFED